MIQFSRLYGRHGREGDIAMYEYVKKSEYAPVRKELEQIINRVQVYMRENYGLTFQFRLIGSGQRHLVTRIKGGNRGYDFDYNLILTLPGDGYRYIAKSIKDEFMTAFKIALQGTKYSFPQDSTSSITIKVYDKGKTKIEQSCDFAIIYYGSNDSIDGYYFLRNHKPQQSYQFAFRSSNFDIDEKVQEIIEDDGWPYIREEYLLLKNINERKMKKPSFSLYAEAVNNVYNQMYYQ